MMMIIVIAVIIIQQQFMYYLDFVCDSLKGIKRRRERETHNEDSEG